MGVLKHAAARYSTKIFALFMVIDDCLFAPSAPSALSVCLSVCMGDILSDPYLPSFRVMI